MAATPTVNYTYDNVETNPTFGQLLSVQVGSFYQETYAYGSYNRVSSLTRVIEGKSYQTSYTCNQASQSTKLTYPSGYAYYQNFDNKGRLQSFSQYQGGNGSNDYVNHISYDIAGQVTGLNLGNGVVETYGYDAQRLQLTSQTATKSSATLLSLTYGYQASGGQNGAGSTAGNSGQLISISGSINGQSESAAYTYDNLYRLLTSNQTTNGTTAQRRFAYDRWGNRTSVYDAISGGTQIQSVSLQQSGGAPTNRLTSVTNGGTATNYTYDNNGNVTNDGVHSYQYDAENRLVSVDSGTTAQYGYDQHNRRVKKAIGSAVTHYVWEQENVIAEHNGSTGSVIVNYVYSNQRLVNKIEGGVTTYYLGDRLSTRLTLDASGNVTGRQAHLPFGEELGTSGTQEKHKFTTYERDGESGTEYAVNRQYSSATGRFLRVDPKAGTIDRPQTLNRYAYVWNDPINLRDTLGLNAQICTTWHVWGHWGPSDDPTYDEFSFTFCHNDYGGGGSGSSGSDDPGNDSPPLDELAPLDSDHLNSITNAFEELLRRLSSGQISEDCKKNVLDKLGITASNLASYLSQGLRAFDGTASTGSVNRIASPADLPFILGNMSNCRTIDCIFAQGTRQRVDAVTAFKRGALTIFFNPSSIGTLWGGITGHNLSLLFHESLHGYGAHNGTPLLDGDLFKKLLGREQREGDFTSEITDHIKKYCFSADK